MADKSEQPKLPTSDLSTLVGRVIWLLQNLWEGKQRRMAADLGVSPAAISRIVHGTQAVGPRMSATIAAYPGVNAEWFKTGLGEPFESPARKPDVDEWLVPVARCILPGPLAEHGHLLTGTYRSVARPDYRATRYLLETQAHDAFVKHPATKIAAGDHILIETDPDVWRENWRVLLDTLVVVRHLGKHGTDYAIVGLTLDPVTGGPRFDSFGATLTPPASPGPIPILVPEDQSRPRRGRSRGIDTGVDPPEDSPPQGFEPTPSPTGRVELGIADVVSYSVNMIRFKFNC